MSLASFAPQANAPGRPAAPLLTPAIVAGVLGLTLLGLLVRYGAWWMSTGGTGVAAYVNAFCVWDCAWYRTIVLDGYDLTPGMRLVSGSANWAFFPLYPAIVALIRWPTGLEPQVIGFFLSNLFIVLAALASRALFGERAAAWWLFVFMLMVGPFSFLFSILYTESLFILLTVLVLVMLQRGRYLAAGGITALLSATRVTGVLMIFAILAQALIDHRRAGGRWRAFPARMIADPALLLSIFIAPLGLFVYAAYLRVRTGDALAFAHIQRAWNRELVNPLTALWDGLSQTLTPTADAQVIMAWSWGASIGFVLCVVLVLQRRIPAAVFCFLSLLLSLSTGVGSMIRFVAGLAPLGMAMADLLARNRLVAWASLPVMMAADIVLTIGWFRSSLIVM